VFHPGNYLKVRRHFILSLYCDNKPGEAGNGIILQTNLSVEGA